MNPIKELLISDFLNYNVSCDQGLDHGPGIMAWMHPPIHRLLGWATRPSALRLLRNVWRLDQLKGINSNQIFVKGTPASSDQATLNRFPTLLEADLINKNGEKIAVIADFVFNIKTGNILYYLVSRSNPKIPGTSRWKLDLNNIKDQQPGLVFTDSLSLNEIPLIKSSLRQDFIKNSKKLRNQFQEISFIANNRLEGWLEELPWDQQDSFIDDRYFAKKNTNFDLFDDWDENVTSNLKEDYNQTSTTDFTHNEEDPWI